MLDQTPDRRERLANIARFARRPRNVEVMAEKVLQRFTERDDPAEAAAWAQERASDVAGWARSEDAGLWEDAEEFGRTQARRNQEIVDRLGVPLGGGGHYPLVHFLIRLRRPRVVVETGVAAGWSSHAALAALERNGRGRLYSSDFPFFRLAEPESVIGVLVPDDLRDRWQLELDGDRSNLRRIARVCGPVGVLHYDSDKTRSGRRRALRILGPVLEPDASILMDDIDDNLFFRDWVTEEGLPHHVFRFEGKYVGLVHHR